MSAYAKFDAALAPVRAANPGTALLGTNVGFAVTQNADGYHYSWDWAAVQRAAQAVADMGLRQPDIWMLQLYNANSSDLARDLAALSGPASANGMSIPASNILAVEFATSSSLAPAPYGNGYASSGDAWTPTTDLDGHAQWLVNALCAYRSAGLTKLAYWALYDAADFWSAYPFNDSDKDLAWGGYWGLFALDPSAAAKPAWDVLVGYYESGASNSRARPRRF